MNWKQTSRLAGLILAFGVGPLAAQDVVWRKSVPTPTTIATTPSTPMVTLGKPVPIASTPRHGEGTPSSIQRVASGPHVGIGRPIIRAQASEDRPLFIPPTVSDTSSAKSTTAPEDPLLGIAPPAPEPPLVKTTSAAGEEPPPPTPPGGGGADYVPGVVVDQPVAPSMWEKMTGWVNGGQSSGGRCTLQSDTCFPGMISPVIMPFYFEDPRSLTEIRPIFMYQGASSNNPIMRGGHSEFFGLQGRLAITESFSVVLHELGFINLSPNNPQPGFEGGTGFAEVKIGPKYTFYRDTNTGSVAAGGLIFEIPWGSTKVFQDTGNLGLAPYLSYAQAFGRLPSGYGSFNFVGNTGYSFSTDEARSQFYYLNLHLDYNIAGLNKFFPLMEMNYLYCAKQGNATNLGFEGQDLINFGSQTNDARNQLTLAFGMRYMFSECIQIGGAVQFPLLNQEGLQDYRLTFDMIFRY